MAYEITDFEKDVLERSRGAPVLVDFWAEWCGPCRVLGPVIERLAEEAHGRWVLAKVNTEQHPAVAERYGIQSIPNVKLFVNAEVVDEFVGALPEPQIRAWLERALPSPASAAVAEASALIATGSFERAATLLRAVLEAEPHHHEARARLAEATLHLDPQAVPGMIQDLDDAPEFAERADVLRTLASIATAAGRPGDLPDAPVKARFLDGARAIRAGEWAAALEALIEVLKRDRAYAGGAARDAGRAIFLLLGSGHPICERYHRPFASALFV